MKSNEVYITQGEKLFYPIEKPYHPSIKYPEYPFGTFISDIDNHVYEEIRILLNAMRLDSGNFNKPQWNPFSGVIKPGNTVLIKPNMVNHFHPNGYTMDSLITNGSIIRCVIDFVIIALQNQGKIIIGDAPIQSADFNAIVKINGLDEIISFYRSQIKTIQFELVDFRHTIAMTNRNGRLIKTLKQCNCECKYVDLNKNSFFSAVENRKFAIADYTFSAMNDYHFDGQHRYLVPQYLLDSDFIINLPKPKTHRFAGLTGAMKNFIGINSQKENLPHHSRGSLTENGDEYPSKSRIKNFISFLTNMITILATKNLYFLSLPLYFLRYVSIRLVKYDKNIYKGSWHGNDTIWRTILDVNRIVLYADKQGKIRDNKQREIFTICDSIISGDKQGPLEPTPKKTNAIIAGFNPYAIDRFLSEFMGFDFNYLPFLKYCPIELGKAPDSELEVSSSLKNWNKIKIKEYKTILNFSPSKGWEIITKNQEK